MAAAAAANAAATAAAAAAATGAQQQQALAMQGLAAAGALPPGPLTEVLRMLTAIATAPAAGDYEVTLASTPAPTTSDAALAALSFLLSTPPSKLQATVANLAGASRDGLMAAITALAQSTRNTVPHLSLEAVLLQWLPNATGAALAPGTAQALQAAHHDMTVLLDAVKGGAGGLGAPGTTALAGTGAASGSMHMVCPPSSAASAPSWPLYLVIGLAVLAAIAAIVLGVLWHKSKSRGGGGGSSKSLSASPLGAGTSPASTFVSAGGVRRLAGGQGPSGGHGAGADLFHTSGGGRWRGGLGPSGSGSGSGAGAHAGAGAGVSSTAYMPSFPPLT